MKKKVTVRARERHPDQKNFSVAMHESLVAELENIAASEDRTRNNQIFRLLKEKVAEYYEAHPETAPANPKWMEEIEQRKG